jgi:hypothetical protein
MTDLEASWVQRQARLLVAVLLEFGLTELAVQKTLFLILAIV